MTRARVWFRKIRDIFICFLCFFFNDTATTEIYTLSLHDALPISPQPRLFPPDLTFCFAHDRTVGQQLSVGFASRVERPAPPMRQKIPTLSCWPTVLRSEEHTSELQSLTNLVCRLLLEKKKNW